MAKFKTVLAIAGGLSAACAGLALAQTQPAPPSWDTLVRCAELGDSDKRLECYDEAMKAAGYAPKPEAVQEARHKRFGLTAPKLAILGHGEGAEAVKPKKEKKPKVEKQARPEENESNITVTLAKVALQGTGKLLMVTDDGQIWEQTDSETVVQLPKEGYAMPIHRGKFGGYFCDISSFKTVRCDRLR